MRNISFYEPASFGAFYNSFSAQIQKKIDYALYILATQQRVPQTVVKHISDSEGIYEVRFSDVSEEYRILFFFADGGDLFKGTEVLITNWFAKKSNKDYKKPVAEAEAIKNLQQQIADLLVIIFQIFNDIYINT